MDIQKVTTGVTAAAVVGTGGIMGGGHLIDQQTGGVKGLDQPKPNGDYRQTTPQR